jgi:tetratricopeptide (TPR) repeat protein
VAAESDLSSHDAAGLIGTSAYMAPEQVEGKPVTQAADIYALGVVVYEMVTGARPFEGETALAVALKRLTEAPVPPRERRPELDPRWDAAILRCLERQPERRFARAEDVAEALGAPPSVRPDVSTRLWVLGTALLGVLGLTLWLAWSRGGARPAAETRASPEVVRARRSVVVMGFRGPADAPGDAWVGTAAGEMLTLELGNGGALRTVPTAVAAEARADLGLTPDSVLTPTVLGRLRQRVGADYVVDGAFVRAGDGAELRLDARLHSAETGETLATLRESGRTDALQDLVSRLAAGLRARLGVEARASEGSAGALPADGSTARLYSEGLARLQAFDPLGAEALLARAAQAEPRHVGIQVALHEALAQLGYEARAEEAARRAYEASSALPLEQRLSVTALFHVATHADARAIDSLNVLREYFPDNVAYGLRLARAFLAAGQGRQALDTVAALRRLPGPAGAQPDLDLVESSALQEISDFKGQLRAAQRAADAGRALGAGLLVAEARYLEAWAALRLAEFEQSEAAFNEARTRYEAAGNRNGAAQALASLGVLQRELGRIAQARASEESALASLRALGNRRGEASVLLNLGILADISGARAEARAYFGQAVAIQRAVGDRAGLRRGLLKLADAYVAEGRPADAASGFTEALELARGAGDQSLAASAAHRLGDVLVAQGRLVPARESYRQALASRRKLAERLNVWRTRLSLAWLTFELGQAEAARSEAQALAEAALAEGIEDVASASLLLAARMALERGDLPAAAAAVERAESLSARSQRPVVRLAVLVEAARVDARQGRHAEALARLRALMPEVGRVGPFELQQRTETALAEAQIAAGQTVAGCEALSRVRRRTSAAGWESLARRAAHSSCPAAG